MKRVTGRAKKQRIGPELVRRFKEVAEILKRGEPLEKHFTVRTVELPDPPVAEITDRRGCNGVVQIRRKAGRQDFRGLPAD